MKKNTIVLCCLILLSACSKNFLDIKPDKSMVVPQTLKDFQAVLDRDNVMNTSIVPFYGDLSSDDIYISDNNWETLANENERNLYAWEGDIYGAMETDPYWNRLYQAVFYANIALEGARKHSKSKERDNIEGSALFYRAWSHYLILQTFAKQYHKNTAKIDLGIPLRLESDINLKSNRGTVQDSYNQIIADLELAEGLLPEKPMIQTRPSKLAVYSLLARVMLQMQEYEDALDFSNKALQIQDDLIDYNLINVNLRYPFKQFNDEVLFQATYYAQSFSSARLQIAPEIYSEFEGNDLRKSLFFFENNGAITFKGSYNGDIYMFGGLSLDELYLIKSETLARINRVEEGISVLNDLLKCRFKNFIKIDVNDKDEALQIILLERRKQLLFRGIRWMDLKRLNLEGQFSKTLNRKIKEVNFQLEPESKKYVFPLPPDVLLLGGLEQNGR